jgi:hypothetical protein
MDLFLLGIILAIIFIIIINYVFFYNRKKFRYRKNIPPPVPSNVPDEPVNAQVSRRIAPFMIDIITFFFIILGLLVVLGAMFAFAGYTSTPPSSTPGATQTATTSAGIPATTTSAPATGSAVSGSDLFGGLSYNWVEYKMSAGSGSDAMTIYYKYNKQTGKCTMRFEGAQVQGMPAEMDCSSSGTTTSDPNKVSSDAQVTCSPVDEPVIVPAGTFTATKCTITLKDGSATTWVVRDKFMVKMQSSSPQGSGEMVLNGYG